MRIKTILLILIGLCTTPYAWAADNCSFTPPQVSLQLTAEQWITTQTAKVSVAWDASLNKDQLARAQEAFQQSLTKISSDSAWHITEFTRSPSKTNLEQIHAVAEARLPETALANIRERAKSLSSEGQTYSIQDIIYSPSQAEISATRAKLRSEIYAQAKEELSRLNAVYLNSGYQLYNITFGGISAQIVPGPNFMAKSTDFASAGREIQPMAVSQQLSQDALIIFAAPAGNLCGKQ